MMIFGIYQDAFDSDVASTFGDGVFFFVSWGMVLGDMSLIIAAPVEPMKRLL